MSYFIIFILLFFSVYQYLSQRRIKKDILAINEKLEILIKEEDYKTLLINCNDKEIQELLLTINKLISEKRLEKTLREERDQKIKEMLSNVSHDLKTPLTVMLGYGEMITLDKEINEEEKKELLKDLMEKIKGVILLINKFFTLAKLESGDEKIEIEKVNISEAIRESIIVFYDALECEGFQVDIDIPEEDLWCYGNKDAILRILNNLISNAIRYGKDGKYLGIKLKLDKDKVNIDVVDKGEGIEEKDKDRIFERSYTGSTSRNNEISGNGLGLCIVKELVKVINGEIHINSIPYKETKFSLTLPTKFIN